MGLLLKLKPKQRTNWKIFFKHALEMYKTDQFIGVPFGKGGYGYVGNPFSRVILEHLHKYSGFSEEFRPILLVKSLELLDSLIPLTPVQRDVVQKWWPGNLIMGFSAEELPIVNTPPPHDADASLHTAVHALLPQLLSLSSINHLFVQVSPHPITQELFTFLEDQHLPPILVGFLAEDGPGVPVVDAESFLNEFADRNLGVILSGGRLQKGSRPLPSTIITGATPESIQIIQVGLITQSQLEEIYSPQTNENDEDNEGDKFDGF